MRRIRPKSKESGTELVELGILLPLIVFLCLGVIDTARVIHCHMVVSNAAREGARLSSLPEMKGDAVASIAGRVQTYIVAENGITCDPSPEVAIDQNTYIPRPDGVEMSASLVNVTCRYHMQYLPLLTLGQLSPDVDIHGRAQFRNFY